MVFGRFGTEARPNPSVSGTQTEATEPARNAAYRDAVSEIRP